jgi:hypothetical protein
MLMFSNFCGLSAPKLHVDIDIIIMLDWFPEPLGLKVAGAPGVIDDHTDRGTGKDGDL